MFLRLARAGAMQAKRALFLRGLHNEALGNLSNVSGLPRWLDAEDPQRTVEDSGGLLGQVADCVRLRGQGMQGVGRAEGIATARANL